MHLFQVHGSSHSSLNASTFHTEESRREQVEISLVTTVLLAYATHVFLQITRKFPFTLVIAGHAFANSKRHSPSIVSVIL